jgi:cobalt-zinc-cadmium efflux system outer membrane protein
MIMMRRTTTLMLAFVVMAAPVRGQQPPRTAPALIDAATGMSLDEAIARALAQEPLVRAGRAEVDVSRGRLQQAGLRPNPTLSFEHRIEPAGTDTQTTAGVEWPLELFRRSARVRTARHELDTAQFAARDRERVLAAEVRLQYGAAAAAARDVTVSTDVAATAERQLELIRARVDAGSTPPLERDLMEVEVRRFRTEELLAVGRAEAALVRLKQLLGMVPAEALTLRQSIEVLVAADPATGSDTEGAIAARPDVREADTRVAVAEARIEQAQREGRVDLSVYGMFMRMDAGFPQQGFGDGGALERVRGRFNYFGGGIMMMVPLFNRNQGQVGAAVAERSVAEARREAAELAARAEVAEAQARDTQAQRAVALFSGGIRDLARRNLDVVRETFQLGRATVFDVLAEQRRYLEIERAYTGALREAWEARASLKAALGESK